MRVKAKPSYAGFGLCGSCRHAQILELDNGEVMVMCYVRREQPMNLTRLVVRCNDHDDKSSTTKWEMEQIAWELRTDKSGRILGFRPPKKEE